MRESLYNGCSLGEHGRIFTETFEIGRKNAVEIKTEKALTFYMVFDIILNVAGAMAKNEMKMRVCWNW